MALSHPIRAHFETGLARLALLVIPRLPRSLIVALARGLGRAARWCTPRLSRVARANLDIAFGSTRSAAEKRRILVSSYQAMAMVVLDIFWFARKSEERIARHVRFSPGFKDLFREKAHIILTAHYGNWEIMGMAITQKGFPLHSVAKPLSNPDVDELFIDARRRTGQQIVTRQGAVRSLLRVLQQGKKVALVVDQNTLPSEGGRFYPFFGLPVPVTTAPAALALKTRSDIFICMMAPTPSGDYETLLGMELPVAPFLELPQAEAVDALTLRITREFEKFLREHPEHWLWSYKRWKLIPEGDDPGRFPYYSRSVSE